MSQTSCIVKDISMEHCRRLLWKGMLCATVAYCGKLLKPAEEGCCGIIYRDLRETDICGGLLWTQNKWTNAYSRPSSSKEESCTSSRGMRCCLLYWKGRKWCSWLWQWPEFFFIYGLSFLMFKFWTSGDLNLDYSLFMIILQTGHAHLARLAQTIG